MKKYFTIDFVDLKNSLVYLRDLEGKISDIQFYSESPLIQLGQLVEVEMEGEKITRLMPLTLDSLMVQSYILYSPEFVHSSEKSYFTVTLERRGQRDGPDRWGIFKGSSVLSKSSKNFEYESMPSSRTDESLADTRFSSAQKAFIFWKQEVESTYEKELQERIALMKK